MPILKPQELDFSKKKIKLIVAGYAGIGKTTLALSAPKPLLIDIENGIDRVEAPYRKDTLVSKDYDELISDLKTSDLSAYQTIVIDTGGKLLDYMKPIVIKENSKNGQRDGSLTQSGWGAVGMKFQEFMNFVDSLGKHLVVIFHAKEEKDGENVKLRIAIEGQSKDRIWQNMDLGGFMEMQGKKRTIGFSNCERYYAKATHGIKGIYEVPELKDGEPNDFLTKLFETVIGDLQKNAKKHSEDEIKYENAMRLKVFIDSCHDLEQINKILERVVQIPHALTSEKELKNHLVAKAKTLGFVYDKTTKAFVKDNGNPAQ